MLSLRLLKFTYLLNSRVTTCVENLEMSGILTAVPELSGILQKVSEVSEKSGQKLLIDICRVLLLAVVWKCGQSTM